VAYPDAPDRLTKGLARHPVPIMLLARLAVSSGSQGQGIGVGLLKDAMLRTVQAADIAGIRALAVHAKDEHARRFYEHFGFYPFGNGHTPPRSAGQRHQALRLPLAS
jgi:predicted N-acetyltransferase YhbS